MSSHHAASLLLKSRLNRLPTLVMPDAFDAFSAILIEQAGFEAVQCSGKSMAAAAGYADENCLSYSENLEVTRKIVNAVSVPVMADGEDGFGNASKLTQTIREFIRIGVAGMNLEDGVLSSWDVSLSVIPMERMSEKIRFVRKAAIATGNPDFVINARTDALSSAIDKVYGLSEAVKRSNCALESGADLAFVTGVTSLDQARELRERINGPISIAAGLAYNSQAFSVADLVNLGVARVSLPLLVILGATQGMKTVLNAAMQNKDFVEMQSAGMMASNADFVYALHGAGGH